MPRFDYSRDQERQALDACFEPDGEGFIYYRDHLARGIPVSASERALFLSEGAESTHDAFREAIAGRRPTRPRRPFLKAYGKTLATLPPHWALGFITVGGSLIVAGMVTSSIFLKYLWIGSGSLGVIFGLQQLIVVLRSR